MIESEPMISGMEPNWRNLLGCTMVAINNQKGQGNILTQLKKLSLDRVTISISSVQFQKPTSAKRLKRGFVSPINQDWRQ
jgi:hypothetical protein